MFVVVVTVLGWRASGSDLKGSVMPQVRVIVTVLVASRDAKDSAGEDFCLRVGCADGTGWVGNTSVDPADQVEAIVDFPQEQQAAIGSQSTTVEIKLDSSSAEAFRSGTFWFTL
jgi:hypothetical protein